MSDTKQTNIESAIPLVAAASGLLAAALYFIGHSKMQGHLARFGIEGLFSPDTFEAMVEGAKALPPLVVVLWVYYAWLKKVTNQKNLRGLLQRVLTLNHINPWLAAVILPLGLVSLGSYSLGYLYAYLQVVTFEQKCAACQVYSLSENQEDVAGLEIAANDEAVAILTTGRVVRILKWKDIDAVRPVRRNR